MTQLDLQQRLEQAEARVKELEEVEKHLPELTKKDFEERCAEHEKVYVSVIREWRNKKGSQHDYSQEKIDDMWLGFNLAKDLIEHKTRLVIRLAQESNKLFKERDALQQQVNALAAENAALKDLQPTRGMVSAAHRELEEYDNIHIDDDAVVFIWQAMRGQQETPATDAVINEWMAKGVEKLLEHLPPYYTARSDIEKFLTDFRAKGASKDE